MVYCAKKLATVRWQKNPITLLLRLNSTVNIMDSFLNFVKYACAKQLSDTCTLLFPQSGNSPLHFAAKYGYLDIVKFLVLHGADPSVSNKVSVIINW